VIQNSSKMITMDVALDVTLLTTVTEEENAHVMIPVLATQNTGELIAHASNALPERMERSVLDLELVVVMELVLVIVSTEKLTVDA